MRPFWNEKEMLDRLSVGDRSALNLLASQDGVIQLTTRGSPIDAIMRHLEAYALAEEAENPVEGYASTVAWKVKDQGKAHLRDMLARTTSGEKAQPAATRPQFDLRTFVVLQYLTFMAITGVFLGAVYASARLLPSMVIPTDLIELLLIATSVPLSVYSAVSFSPAYRKLDHGTAKQIFLVSLQSHKRTVSAWFGVLSGFGLGVIHYAMAQIAGSPTEISLAWLLRLGVTGLALGFLSYYFIGSVIDMKRRNI